MKLFSKRRSVFRLSISSKLIDDILLNNTSFTVCSPSFKKQSDIAILSDEIKLNKKARNQL